MKGKDNMRKKQGMLYLTNQVILWSKYPDMKRMLKRVPFSKQQIKEMKRKEYVKKIKRCAKWGKIALQIFSILS